MFSRVQLCYVYEINTFYVVTADEQIQAKVCSAAVVSNFSICNGIPEKVRSYISTKLQFATLPTELLWRHWKPVNCLYLFRLLFAYRESPANINLNIFICNHVMFLPLLDSKYTLPRRSTACLMESPPTQTNTQYLLMPWSFIASYE